MKAHPNVLARAPSGRRRDQFNFKSTGPALPCSPLCVSRPPLPSPLGPGRDRTRPCGTLCESGGWLHCVRQASRTSLVLVLRFNSQIRPALPFLFPFDLGHTLLPLFLFLLFFFSPSLSTFKFHLTRSTNVPSSPSLPLLFLLSLLSLGPLPPTFRLFPPLQPVSHNHISHVFDSSLFREGD